MESQRAAEGERRVAADQWDIDGWQILASEVGHVPFATAKPIYERLVSQFPSVGRFWQMYAEHLIREDESDSEAIKSIYERAVQSAPTAVDLWQSYVKFSASLSAKVPGSKLETDAIAVQEKSLSAAGLDLNANPLWTHYIEFIKTKTSLSDSQRRDSLRRLYQRAVRNPMHNLDAFWREYTTFEQNSNTNKEVARALIAEHQPKNIDARAEFRARRSRREGLTLSVLPVPPRGRAKESSQAQQWRRFIANERTNPFSLSESDLHGRILHAFESALGPLYRYPDIWLEYLSYVYGTYIKDGQTQLPKSGAKEASGTTRDDSHTKKAADALEPLLTRAVKALPDNVGLHHYVNYLYVRLGNPAKGVSTLDSLCKRNPSPLAYVHLMRAARKADGRDAARKVFGRARKDPKANKPAVYVAAALMEFSVNKDNKVARNVFEFGLKNNEESALMALQYVNWLWGVGDLEYARVVLKKVMPLVKGPPEDVRRLWERWIEVEETIGDTAGVDKVEAMWRETESGKHNTVVQDVLRRSRFLSYEGLTEDDVSAIDGVRVPAAEKTTGASGGSAGKRDPRTGRRVASAVGNKDGTSNGTTNARKSSDTPNQESSLKIAMEWLQRMAAAMPHIDAPPPTPEVLFRMVMDTPDGYAETPAGARGTAGTRPGKKQEQMVGKKRKGEELAASQSITNASAGSGGTAAPTQDVFRARQAAKQSRMR